MTLRTIFVLACLLSLSSCSTITKKDCEADMYQFGLNHGRNGSPKKFTEQLRSTCYLSAPPVDLENYEKGFEAGWKEYCRPANALSLGKISDPYVSFCPSEKEAVFREKYLIGKRINELKDIENEMIDELADLREDSADGEAQPEEIRKKEKDLVDIRKSITELEIAGLKDSLTLMNHL